MDIFRTAQSPEGLSREEIARAVEESLAGRRVKRALLLPPDFTRFHSNAGLITQLYYKALTAAGAQVDVMPALGTHVPVTREQYAAMFGGLPYEQMLVHNWRTDVARLGEVPGELISRLPGGLWSDPVEVEVNRRLLDPSYDLILSIGQVVPHEVIGMSNYTKNILVGLGGRPMINGTHMLGALCNLETIMGNTDTPVRAVFDYGEEHFLRDVPLAYILTVASEQEGRTALHGIFTGASRQVYEHAAALAKRRCITQVERRAKKVVAYLEPEEFSTTWVGNKAIYRTRMMIEDGGELLVIAPGIKGFGENPEVDGLIRRYGYKGTPYTMELMENGAFPGSAMVPAHMIHSSSEGRFTITYAVNPEYVSQDEIGRIGYEFMDVKDALARYPVLEMEDGWQEMEDGEEIYVVKAPALGLWRVMGV